MNNEDKTYSTQDFVKAFAKNIGFDVKDDDAKNFTILLPHIMMNVAYQCYRNDILPLKIKFTLKMHRKKWSDAYDKFNGTLFNGMDIDMQDALCDKMERFVKYSYLDIVSLQGKAMKILPPSISTKDKQILSSVILCNRIAKCAFDIYAKCNVANLLDMKTNDVYIVPIENTGLKGVVTSTREFLFEYVKHDKHFLEYETGNAEEELKKAIEQFKDKCHKFADFESQAS